jgi:hypothetical protein
MVLDGSRPDMDGHARRRGSASALTARTAATMNCRKDRRCPSVFLPQGPETVHMPVKMQGVNYSHGTIFLPVIFSRSEGSTFEKRIPRNWQGVRNWQAVLQFADGFGDYCLRFAVLGGVRIRPAHATARSESG